MMLWRLLRARLHQDRQRLLTALVVAALANGLLIFSLAERLGEDPDWSLPIGVEQTVLLLSVTVLGQVWVARRLAIGMAGTARQIRRSILTTWLSLEPEARAGIRPVQVMDALSATPQALVRLAATWPAAAFSAIATLGCVTITLYAAPAAGAALLVTVKLAGIARAAQAARIGRNPPPPPEDAPGPVAAAAATPHDPADPAPRPRRFWHRHGWAATEDVLTAAARPALAILLVMVSRLSGGATSEAVSMALIAFLLPLDWIAAIPGVARLAAATERLAATEAELLAAAARWPTPPPVGAGMPFAGLELVNATLRYTPQPGVPGGIVGPVNCRAAAGRITAILGDAGCGKTSVLRLLAGLDRPATGGMRLNGAPVDPFGCRHLVWHVPAQPVLFAGQAIAGGDRSEILALLEDLDLRNVLGQRPERIPDTEGFSIALRARIALLLAIASDRPVLLLDEPELWQDARLRRRLFDDILPRLRHAGRAAVFTTTDERLAGLADEVVRLRDGRQVTG